MKLPQDLAAKLTVPLPREAIKPHPTKPYLSSINSIYVTERLNDVFGVGGWVFKVDFLGEEIFDKVVKGKEVKGRMVTVKVTFTVPEYGIELEQFGGNDNEDKGDALKGATTDALTKIGSYLGIGQDVWKDKKPQINQETGEIITPKSSAQESKYSKYWKLSGQTKDGKDLVSGSYQGREWFARVENGERVYYKDKDDWIKDHLTTDKADGLPF